MRQYSKCPGWKYETKHADKRFGKKSARQASKQALNDELDDIHNYGLKVYQEMISDFYDKEALRVWYRDHEDYTEWLESELCT